MHNKSINYDFFFRNLKMNILLIVSSHPKHFAHRDAIRSTWGNNFNDLHTIQPKLHGQIIFQIGLDPKSFGIDRLVQEESVQYGDILIQDFIEHYNNLTIKTIMLLKYLNHLAVIPSFIFKVGYLLMFDNYSIFLAK